MTRFSLNDCIVDVCERCGNEISSPPYCTEMFCRDCLIEITGLSPAQLDKHLSQKYRQKEMETEIEICPICSRYSVEPGERACFNCLRDEQTTESGNNG